VIHHSAIAQTLILKFPYLLVNLQCAIDFDSACAVLCARDPCLGVPSRDVPAACCFVAVAVAISASDISCHIQCYCGRGFTLPFTFRKVSFTAIADMALIPSPFAFDIWKDGETSIRDPFARQLPVPILIN
jgi:hypothetical protein